MLQRVKIEFLVINKVHFPPLLIQLNLNKVKASQVLKMEVKIKD